MKNKLIASLTLCIFSPFWGGAQEKARPNVVVFLVDDLGWIDVACNGSKRYLTPNVDRLAKKGIRFTQAYAAHPVCSPTRASLMTGKNPARCEIGITDWIPGNEMCHNQPLLPPNLKFNLAKDQKTMGEIFKENGYATWFVGKWHLGENQEFWPQNRGFDVNYGGCHWGHPRGPTSYWAPFKNPSLNEDGTNGDYLTDFLKNKSLELIRQRDKTKPFLLYHAFYQVHTPIKPKPDLVQQIKEYWQKKGIKDTTPIQQKETGGYTQRLQQNSAEYAAMVKAMDDTIGEVMSELEKENLLANTIILFTSDNGGLSTLMGNNGGPTSNAPLRYGKGFLTEGGIRVPLILCSPFTKPKKQVCNTPVWTCDVLPTLMDCAGIPLQSELHKDGISLKPLLKDEPIVKERALIWHYPHYHGSGHRPGSAMRKGAWKIIYDYETKTSKLFNVTRDPGENKDLANLNSAMKKRTKNMTEEMLNWLQYEAKTTFPKVNPNYKTNK